MNARRTFGLVAVLVALGLLTTGAASAAEEPAPPEAARAEPPAALVDSPREESPPSEGRTRRELAAGESVIIELATVEDEVIFELVLGEASFALRATPDGFVQLMETKARINVAATNEEGNRVSFGLITGEKVSIWPVARIKVTAATGEFSIDALASGWAFVVRADEVRPGGLPFRCDEVPGTLQAGERLDGDREANKIIFRKIGKEWPGKPVLVQAPKAPPRPPAPPAEERRREGGPVPPGVIADRGRDFPWQTIPLPAIAWEVFRPPDVSP